MKGRHALFVLVLALAAWPLVVPQAWGHAAPVNYSISPNFVFPEVQDVPQQLTISFSERPDPRVSYIRVTDSNNVRIDNDDYAITGENNRQATVTLDTGNMHEGIYTVSWFAMSLDDGHITQGAYVFGVGDVTVVEPAERELTDVTSFADALVKWPLIVSQAAAVGMAAAALVLQRSLALSGSKRLGRLLLACSAAIGSAATGLLLLQASNIADATGSYTAAIESLLDDSPAGNVWIMRIVSAAAIGSLATAYLFRPNRLILAGVIAAGSLSVLSNGMLSHNSAAPFMPELAVAADWIHFMSVSVWVGGLFYIAAIFVPAARISSGPDRTLALALPRFSLVATMSLGAIGITGIYMAWLHLHSLEALFTSVYGANLAIKLAAVVPMLLLGVYHQVRVHKSMIVMATTRGSAQSAAKKFGKTVRIEAIIGIGVLLAASMLTVTSPPAQQLAGSEAYVHRTTVDDTDIVFEISPFRPGFNTFTVMLTKDGIPTDNIHHAIMRLTNEGARVGPLIVHLDDAGDGLHTATGGYMNQEGEWRIDFIAQRTGTYDLNYTFRETLSMTTEPPEMDPELDSFAGLAIGLAVMVAGASAFYTVQSRRQMKNALAVLK